MSPVFRHGRLRLYLLKLLDEAPRHGYEVIRLLQDRFLGVYSPSPGTIYPRLARLEEEGLVTHDEVDGRKVYRITAKGREEIEARLDDLAELEEQLTETARGIAAGISRDVRDTVRSLREEFGRVAGSGQSGGSGSEPWGRAAFTEPGHGRGGTGSEPWARAAFTEPGHGRGGSGSEPWARAAFTEPGHGSAESSGQAGGPRGRPGSGPGGRPGARAGASTGPAPGPGPGAAGPGSGPGGRRKGLGSWPDLERLAMDFVKDIQSTAARAANLDETGLRDLRGILADAMSRISTEVFGDSGKQFRRPQDRKPGGGEQPGGPDSRG